MLELWIGLIVLFCFSLYRVFKGRPHIGSSAKYDSFSKWHRETYNVSVEECPDCQRNKPLPLVHTRKS